MRAALKNRRFLVCGGGAALCLLFLVGSVLLHAKRYYSLYAQRAAAGNNLNTLRRDIEGVDTEKLEQENQSLADELGEIERSLPERDYVPTLIREIESGAAMTGNELSELDQGEIITGKIAGVGPPPGEGQEGEEGNEEEAPVSTGQRYSEMDIDIRLHGSFAGAFEFIRHLGKIGKIISVEIVEIERAGQDEVTLDGHAAARIRLGCKAYILAPQSGFPGQITIKIY